jgi:hypothetical protein
MIDRKWLSTPSLTALALLLAITLAVRVGVLAAMRENLAQDPDAYRNIANNLVWFRVYGMGHSRSQPPPPTAYRPPLYPLVLAKFASDEGGVVLWRVAAVHVLLGMATVWLVWVVAGQIWQSGPLASQVDEHSRSQCTTFRFAAGLFVACDPILINQSTLVMTETLAAFLTVVCLFCLNRFASDRRPWHAGLAGAAIALAVLCRPTYLPWLALIGVAMLFLRSRGGSISKVQSPNPDSRSRDWGDCFRRGLNVGALVLIAASVLSPWVVRNYRVFDKPIVTTTHGGYTFYLGNNAHFFRYLAEDKSGLAWGIDSRPPSRIPFSATTRPSSFREESELDEANLESVLEAMHMGRLNEMTREELQYRRAFDIIELHPSQFAYACLYRLRQLWSPLPHQLTADEPTTTRLLRYAVAAWYIGVYLLAATGIWKLRSKLLAPPWLWGVLLCLVFTGIHTFYWTNLRMRAPLMPFVALVAACGVAWLWSWRVGQARQATAVAP